MICIKATVLIEEREEKVVREEFERRKKQYAANGQEYPWKTWRQLAATFASVGFHDRVNSVERDLERASVGGVMVQ